MKKIKMQKYEQKSKRRNRAGFALSELMLTVGILVVLMAFAFVALIQYQKSLKLTEMDNTAKEIFVAAQNHMTALNSSGEWTKLAEDTTHEDNQDQFFGETLAEKPGDFDSSEADFTWGDSSHKFYYITYYPGEDAKQKDSILSEILPFGAIDDTVRSGGSYVIEYDYTTASVYGVFYTDQKDAKIDEDYQALNQARGPEDDAKKERRSYKPIIGYYGGAAAKKLKGTTLKTPDVTIDNSDKLVVDITAIPNDVTNVTFTITGEESRHTQKYAWTRKRNAASATWWNTSTDQTEMKLVLDDITSSDGQFYNQFCDSTLFSGKTNVNYNQQLIPGENITVCVKFSSTSKLANVVSKDGYTNSLFESKYVGTDKSVATVANIRHLQNLNHEVSALPTASRVEMIGKPKIESKTLIEEVDQTKDLNWTKKSSMFYTDLFATPSKDQQQSWNDQTIYGTDKKSVSVNSFYGVINERLTKYNGNQYKLQNFVLGACGVTSENADKTKVTKYYYGIFPLIRNNVSMSISHVLIENITANASADHVMAAGALAGSVEGRGASIEDVGVYCSNGNEAVNSAFYTAHSLNGNSADIGGLIGSVNVTDASITVSKSFASVWVSTVTGNAGGLIGLVNGNASNSNITVSNSYAGGFTQAGQYNQNTVNVNSTSGNAGGLIGAVKTSAEMKDVYSTCSVQGKNAGGLLGNAEGSVTAQNSYCVGIVWKNDTNGKIGAFAGIMKQAALTNCAYVSGNNAASVNAVGDPGESTYTFGSVGNSDVKNETHSYDSTLVDSDKTYPFVSVNTTGAVNAESKGVHYGDWQESNDNFEGTIAYYEIYLDKEGKYILGLYNEDLNIKLLEDDQAQIIQDGYVVLSEKQGNVQVDGISTHQIEEVSRDGLSLKNSIIPKTNSLKYYWTMNDSEHLYNQSVFTIQGGKSYYLYFMDLDTVDGTSATSYYGKFNVSMGGSDSGTGFYFNPHYAKSRVSTSDITTAAGPAQTSIRTERQYSMFTQDLQNPGATLNTIYGVYYNKYFAQENDLDFSSGTKYTSTYFGKNANEVTEHSTVAALAPAIASANTMKTDKPQDTVGFQGTYDGKNHSISHLRLTGEVGKSAGMFGNTQGALICNLTLKDIHVNVSEEEENNQPIDEYASAGNCDYVGSVVGSAAHTGIWNWGSKNCFTQIENVSVNDAVLRGKKNVGGLVGAGYSCAVNYDNGSTTLSNIQLKGDSLVGGVFGDFTNYGGEIKNKTRQIIVQNITTEGTCQVIESANHSTNAESTGIGGFAGRMKLQAVNDERKVRITNINLVADMSIKVGVNASSNSYVWAGGFVGNLMSTYHASYFVVSNNQINHLSVLLNGTKSYSTIYGVGGLYGVIRAEERITNNITLGNDVNIENHSQDPLQSGYRYSVGNVAGLVSKNAAITWDTNAYDSANVTYKNMNANTVESFGRYIGRMMDGAVFTALPSIQVNPQSGIDAMNNGGLIGNMTGKAKVKDATISNVAGNMTSGSINVGGVVGKIASESSIENVAVSAANLSVTGNGESAVGVVVGNVDSGSIKNTHVDNATLTVNDVGYAGGLVGSVLVTTAGSMISDSYVDNPVIIGNAAYLGGFAGMISSGTVTNCDVRSTMLKDGSYTKNEAGEYIVDGTVSQVCVKNLKASSFTGGFSGQLMAADVKDCFAAIPVRSQAVNTSLGGFAGVMHNGTITDSYASCNVINYDYSVSSHTGGFVGDVNGASTIYDCYATGDVQKGAVVGGFAGILNQSSMTYINNSYSLGIVDQQISQDATAVHGGFVGANYDSLQDEPIDLNQKQVGTFYSLLKMDLSNYNQSGFTETENTLIKKCLLALIKREGGKTLDDVGVLQGNTSVMKYIDYYQKIHNKQLQVDSSASHAQNADLEDALPSVATVVSTLLAMSEFNSVEKQIKTWRLSYSDDLYFYYSVIDIDTYDVDSVETAAKKGMPYTIVGYKYEQDSKGLCWQTRGTLPLGISASYGRYVVLKDFVATSAAEKVEVPTQLTKEYYTGCTFLSDSGYNECDTWSDEKWNEYVSSKNFNEFTDADGEYLKNLNLDEDDSGNTNSNRFQMGATTSNAYDKGIGETFIYPSMNSKVGAAQSELTHWGDWPEKKEYVGLVYYEKLHNDPTLYYHGYNSSGKEIKSVAALTDSAGKYVQEDGYMVVLPESVDVKDVKVKFDKDGYVSLGDYIKATPVAISAGYKGYIVTKFYIYTPQNYRDAAGEFRIQTGAETAIFTMNPYFADSVQYGKVEEKTFYIRSARHLNNVADLSSIFSSMMRAGYVFEQTLDISYSKGDTGAEYSFEKPIIQFNAEYESKTYVDRIYPSNTLSYSIKGLSCNMFDRIDESGKVRGVCLTDLVTTPVSNQDVAVGFVRLNNGTIENCSIRPSIADANENTSEEYDNVKIGTKSSKSAAGFVYQNTGTIKDSYVVGTVTGENAAGFVAENNWNNAVIQNCYANCITTSTDTATGFCTANDWGAIINDCHALKSVNAGKGNAYAFMKENNGTIENNYAALDSLQGGVTYSFGGTKGVGICYDKTIVTASNTKKSTGVEKTYTQLQREAQDEDNAATKNITNRYRTDLPEIYPFALPETEGAYTTMQHYGDWPVKQTDGRTVISSDKVALVYYEIIGENLYYHGYAVDTKDQSVEVGTFDTSGTATGLLSGAGKYVSESGYLLVTSDQNITKNNQLTTFIDGQKISSFNQDNLKTFDRGTFASGLDAYKITGIESECSSERASVIEFRSKGNVAYEITYTMTPYFADSVQLGSVSERTYYIRSKQDLNNLQKQKEFAEKAEYSFIQQLDIKYAEETTDYIDKFSGIYHSSLYYESGNKLSYCIEGMTSPLFGTIEKGANVYNVTLANSNYGSSSSNDRTAGFVKENKGTIENCCVVVKNGTYENVQITAGKNVAGFVYRNLEDGIIRNSYVVGTIIGGTNIKESKDTGNAAGFVMYNGGEIDSCYANTITTSKASGFAAGFVGYNQDSGKSNGAKTIKNSHALLSVTAEGGDAFGFVSSNPAEATIQNCYVAMETISGQVANTFGENVTEKDSCYYLNTCSLMGSEKVVRLGEGKSFEELKQLATNKATISTTHPYNNALKDTIYPFDLPVATVNSTTPLTMQHYGDWPAAQLEQLAVMSPAQDTTETQSIHTGIAYYENNNAGYEGWYAVTDSGSGDDAPFNTLVTDQNFNIADTDTAYGVLIQSGNVPQVLGAEIEKSVAAIVNIDGVDYDFYRLIQDEKHEAVHVTVQGAQADDGSSYIYNDDFAAAISTEKSLGVTAENGGRPYQIRTNEQLRNINANKALYMTNAFCQTLDIALTADNFTPLGGSDVWTEDETYIFSGSYDASTEIPEGYTISGLDQTITFTSVDGNDHTGSDEAKNDQYKCLYGGLFASVSGSVQGVKLSGNVNIVRDASESYLQGCVGSVAGAVTEGGSISNANSDVTITVDSKCLDMKLGGMAGYNDGTIQNSYYNGAIQNWYYDEAHIGQLHMQNKAGYTADIGGFVGLNTGTIDQSSAAASISLKTGNTDVQPAVYGGFAGMSGDENSSITNSWSKSVITDATGTVGGFVGATVDYSQNANEKKVSVLRNNYAIVSLQNIAAETTVGLFAGHNATSDIWKCYAAEFGGDGYIFSSTHVFLNGKQIDLNVQSCFIWNGLDTMPFDSFNADGLWNLNNGLYPMLNLNIERESDIVKVTGAIMPAEAVVPADVQTEDSGDVISEETTPDTTGELEALTPEEPSQSDGVTEDILEE